MELKGSKTTLEIKKYYFNQIKDVKFGIYSITFEHMGLQIADLFSWGIFKKYEKSDTGWFAVFKEKVLFDEMFL